VVKKLIKRSSPSKAEKAALERSERRATNRKLFKDDCSDVSSEDYQTRKPSKKLESKRFASNEKSKHHH